MALLKKFFYMTLTQLWKYCYRHGIVICSRDTWFKYVHMFDIERGVFKNEHFKWPEGIRPKKVNEIWHIDITEFKLPSGEKVYLQAIIDNFSRYVIDFEVKSEKLGLSTMKLIERAQGKISTNVGTAPLNLFMDAGTENLNSNVDRLFLGRNLKRVIAKTDVKHSNSMIESFFRSLKNNYLYTEKFENLDELNKAVGFYINRYNNQIPHSAFQWQTPREIYSNSWTNKDDLRIEFMKKETNLKYQKCQTCLI